MNRLLAKAARIQAEAMIQALESLRPGGAQVLATSALAELRTWPELSVRTVPDSQASEGCSVAGIYLPGQPPILAVARSTSEERRDFTALHELGHHLQQTDFDLIDVLVEHGDDGQALQEAACDAFAAAILLPQALVAQHILARGPDAADVVGLWHAAGASRMAVCVAAAQHLPAPGHILLLDTDGAVMFAASHNLPQPRRGSDQSRIPVLATALTTESGRAQGRTRLRYRDGIAGAELYVQTTRIGGYLLAVLVIDRAPWLPFSPTLDDSPLARWYICEHCGQEFRSFDRTCERCHVPRCPECNSCGCPSPVEQRSCPECFLMHPPSMFAAGSDRCLDCS
jgi:hypothetical protein